MLFASLAKYMGQLIARVSLMTPLGQPKGPVSKFARHLNLNFLSSLFFYLVLIGYLCTDFEGGEKPKGGPLEIKIFLLKGVSERG